jgi:(2Fe-2S) ferredoxin
MTMALNDKQRELINNCLIAMGQETITSIHDEQIAANTIDAQINECGMWDAYDAADSIRDSRQQVVRVQYADNKAIINAPVYAVGDRVKENNYGHIGTVVDVRNDAHVTWYKVMYTTAMKDVFSEHLASELSRPVPFGWDKV